MPTIMNANETFTGVKVVEKKDHKIDSFRFEYWLTERRIEVAAVYELATGLSFPRKGPVWTGLHQELLDIEAMMMKEKEARTIGYYVKSYLQSRLYR